jgi:hypothetical protein
VGGDHYCGHTIRVGPSPVMVDRRVVILSAGWRIVTDKGKCDRCNRELGVDLAQPNGGKKDV